MGGRARVKRWGSPELRAWDWKPRNIKLVLSSRLLSPIGQLTCSVLEQKKKWWLSAGIDMTMFKLSCFQHVKLLKHAFMVLALSVLDEICSFFTPASELWQNQACGTSEGDSSLAQLYNYIFSFWTITFGPAYDKAAVVTWSLHGEGRW